MVEEEAGLSFVSRNCYPFTESSRRLIYFDYQIRFIRRQKSSSCAGSLTLMVLLLKSIAHWRWWWWWSPTGEQSLRIAHYLFQLDVGLFNGTNPISKARKNDYTHTQSLESIGQKHLVDWWDLREIPELAGGAWGFSDLTGIASIILSRQPKNPK